MKINQSLARFHNLITGLVVWGAILALIGLIVIATHQGYDFDAAAILNGVSLAYVGSGLIGLAIFGAFLRITATSIIEGLGGNLLVSVEDSAAILSTRNRDTDSDIANSLTDSQWAAWKTSGSPKLDRWVAAGSPDFRTWLNDES